MCEQMIRTAEVNEDATSKDVKVVGSKRKMEEVVLEEVVLSSVGRKSKRKRAKE